MLTSTFSSLVGFACSMCKITANGRTIVGNNEDNWRTGYQISFERGIGGGYGAVYFAHETGVPQGGMNEAGLAFDGLTVYPRTLRHQPGKKKIDDPTGFIKNILQQCATVQQVKTYVEQYDRSIFNRSMFMFIDKTGEYLVVEVDTVMLGNDPAYVLANFCPSQIKPEDVKLDRYRRGNAFLRNNPLEASIAYGTALMKAMHECRSKIGDGTMYTSVYDLNDGALTLYFYHDYGNPKSFRLQDELAKPDHTWEVAALFPKNKEYMDLLNYATPFNNHDVQGMMEIVRRLLPAMSLLYLFLIIRSKWKRKVSKPGNAYAYITLAISNIILSYFVTLLLTDQGIYYFDFPYSFETTKTVDIMVYVPLALLIAFVPVAYSSFRMWSATNPGKILPVIICLNLLIYLALLIAAGYWGLLGIF